MRWMLVSALLGAAAAGAAGQVRKPTQPKPKTDAPATLDDLVRRLKSPVADRRKAAAMTLAEYGYRAQDALPALDAAADDENPGVAAAAKAASKFIRDSALEAVRLFKSVDKAAEAGWRDTRLPPRPEPVAKSAAPASEKPKPRKSAQADDYEDAFRHPQKDLVGQAPAPGADPEAEKKRREAAAKEAAEAQERRATWLELHDPTAEANAKTGDPIDAAAGWWKRDGIRVSIPGVQMGSVFVGAGRAADVARGDYLTIAVRVENVTGTKRIAFSGWGAGGAALRDQSGKALNPAQLPGKPWRSVDSVTLSGDSGALEHLVFEAPAGDVQFLMLELSASNFGGNGVIKFKLPRSMWGK